MKLGVIIMQPQSADFDLSNQRLTNAQVLAWIHDLPWEHWDLKILFSIAKRVGALLKIDNAMLEGNFGHFARLLIDVDLSKELLESLMIEREGHKFFIHIEYENLPTFCIICLAVGHSLANCRRNPTARKTDASSKNQKAANEKAQPKKLVYKEK